jgi:hypothetical protein
MLPNFIVAGAEKTGSTSLYEYLKRHPDVFMSPVKEPEYFILEGGVTDISEYESLFDGVESESAIGEASVGYFYSDGSAARINEHIPEATIIVLLRDPAERAFSHYNMLREKGAVPNRPFLDALHEAEREGSFTYTGLPTSRYSARLQQYKSVFGDQLNVYLHRQLKEDPLSTVQAISEDIGVDSDYVVDTTQNYNETEIPKSASINQLIWGESAVKERLKGILPQSIQDHLRELITTVNRDPPPPLSPEARQFVIEELREDIEKTEELLGYDLSSWKS